MDQHIEPSESVIGTADACFNYTPLQPDITEFRLIELLPSHVSEPPLCRIFHASIESWRRKYTALSYVWGSDRSDQPWIYINNHVHKVRRNLGGFLKSCRQRHDWQFFWVDALCIDQGNRDEKSHQVAIMKDIYESALVVYAWLGDPPWPDFNRVIGMLKTWYQSRDSLGAVECKTAVTLVRDEKLAAFIDWLSEHHYFSRIWIIQELVLARSVQLVFENSRVFMERACDLLPPDLP